MRTRHLPLLLTLLVSLSALAACGDQRAQRLRVEQTRVRVDSTFASLGEAFPGYLSSAEDLAFDRQGRLHVLDRMESRVVVFDPDLRPLRVIGRKGEGPGEMRTPSMGAQTNSVAAGGGLVVVVDGRRRVHVFGSDGGFRTRFESPRSVTDVAITTEGRILCAQTGDDQALIEYSVSGDSLRAYGTPTLPIDLSLDSGADRTLLGHLWTMNSHYVEVLSDGRVVTLNQMWPLLRIYRDGELQRESRIDLEGILPLLEDEGARQVLESLIDAMEALSPEEITRRFETGRLERAELPDMSPLWDIAARGDEIWLNFFYLTRLDERGRIQRVLKAEDPGFAYTVVLHGDRGVSLNPGMAVLKSFRIP